MGNSMKRKLIWSFSLLLFIGSLSVVQGHEGWNDKEEDSVLPSVDSATPNDNVYYVSVKNGSNRNNGSKDAPFKDLQKAVDAAEEGSTIYVSEGNYLGN